MTTELGLVDTWLTSTLTGHTGLTALVGSRVYDALAPQGAVYPHVVFQLQAAGADTVVVGGIRLAANVLYAVRAVTAVLTTAQSPGYASARAIAAQIDAALHAKRATVTGGAVLSCHRERPLKLPPETSTGGAMYYAEGGLYRIRVRVS